MSALDSLLVRGVGEDSGEADKVYACDNPRKPCFIKVQSVPAQYERADDGEYAECAARFDGLGRFRVGVGLLDIAGFYGTFYRLDVGGVELWRLFSHDAHCGFVRRHHGQMDIVLLEVGLYLCERYGVVGEFIQIDALKSVSLSVGLFLGAGNSSLAAVCVHTPLRSKSESTPTRKASHRVVLVGMSGGVFQVRCLFFLQCSSSGVCRER